MYSRPNNSNIRALAKVALFCLALVIFLIVKAMDSNGPQTASHRSSVNPIEQELQPRGSIQRKEGIAVAVLIDSSGSMSDSVTGSGGQPTQKMEIARRCLLALIKQADDFASNNNERPLLLGVYEFSSRDRGSVCRNVVPIGRPNAAAALPLVRSMFPQGNTPIGDSMITAYKDLAATGMSRLHILVITDGENNHGYALADVVSAISRLNEVDRPAMYFLAFDIAERLFAPLRDSGAMVLSASNEADLHQTLNYILTGKILAEQP